MTGFLFAAVALKSSLMSGESQPRVVQISAIAWCMIRLPYIFDTSTGPDQLLQKLFEALPTVEWIYFVLAIITFFSLFFITAPYGRHNRRGWGVQIDATPGWILMESVALFALPFLIVISGKALNAVSVVFLSMWCGHYLYRSIVFPVQRRHYNRKMPLLVMGLAIFHNLLSSYVNGVDIFIVRAPYSGQWLFSWQFIVGTALFFVGMGIHIHSDSVLLKIQQKNQGYQVPYRGLHLYLASPNYFGEILQWTGWAIATWSVGGALFAFFTFCNLAPRAHSHLKWYRQKFDDYPGSRKAIIPGIW
jgi:steroid 5-alpha reductase family enzyme